RGNATSRSAAHKARRSTGKKIKIIATPPDVAILIKSGSDEHNPKPRGDFDTAGNSASGAFRRARAIQYNTFTQAPREVRKLMKRLLALVSVTLLLALLAGGAPTLAQDDGQAARFGAAVYAEFCQTCHGPRGEAIAEGAAFQAIAFDAEMAREGIAQGRDSDPDDGAAMPAYAQTSGGPLSEAQIDQVMAYMATWESGDVPSL